MSALASDRQQLPGPEIPGLEYVRRLGEGGSAEVHLYREHGREVAVKVLRSDVVSVETQRRFTGEAALMRELSQHPNIVTIYQAGISIEGWPYIVMEYYSGGSLAQQSRSRGPLPVEEVLAHGVQIACAVETAHQADIVHRDIKPGNILISSYGRPGLTDFGISSKGTALGDVPGALSPSWAPPEAFVSDDGIGPRSDVYALCATLWTLLNGRPPFERPGGDNGYAALEHRTRSELVPTLGRPGVHPLLEQLLHRGMAKHPAQRQGSARDVATGLREVQQKLGLPVTALELPATALPSPAGPAGQATSLRRPPAPTPPVVPDQATAGPAPGRERHFLPDRELTRTVHRNELETPAGPTTLPDPAPAGPGWSRRRVVAAAAAVAALIAGGAAAAAVGGGSGPAPVPTPPRETDQGDALTGDVPAPQELTLRRARAGRVVVGWVNPDPRAGDRYLWNRTDPGVPHDQHEAKTSSVTLTVGAGERPCVEVRVVRGVTVGLAPAAACLDAG